MQLDYQVSIENTIVLANGSSLRKSVLPILRYSPRSLASRIADEKWHDNLACGCSGLRNYSYRNQSRIRLVRCGTTLRGSDWRGSTCAIHRRLKGTSSSGW